MTPPEHCLQEFETSPASSCEVATAVPSAATAWAADRRLRFSEAAQRDGAPHRVDPLHPEHVSDIADVFPSGYTGGTAFEIPPYAFRPDQWSKALLRGLANPDLQIEGRDVLELGIGAGPNTAYLLQNRAPRRAFGSDLDGRCTALAARNIYNNVDPEKRCRFRPIYGDRDLAEWIKKYGFAQVSFGCLPQVVKATSLDLHEGDNLAHYYDPARYQSELHHLGLGLNDYFLRQIYPLLPDGGDVVLNLGGRPGREKALEDLLFRKNGFEPHLLHEEVIEQHHGTSLATLAAVEDHHQHEFEFFTDPDGSPASQIPAAEAERKRLAGQPIYHKIYVINGRKVPR